MKKTSKHTRIIDTVKVMVAPGQPIEYKIPSTFTGEHLRMWKERNLKELTDFIRSVDPYLLTVKHTHRAKKDKASQISDYSGSRQAERVNIETVIEVEENGTDGGADEE